MEQKKILYIDCFSGISGDMTAAALLDLGIKGVDKTFILKGLKKIHLSGYGIDVVKEKMGGISATRFTVSVESGQPMRRYTDIKEMIGSSSLDKEVKDLSLKIFGIIAEAESVVHGRPVEEVHFHEVGAVDSIIDIVATALAISALKIEKVFCSRVPLGKGKTNSMHGIIPVPAPATLFILKGIPVYGGGYDFEVTTPTGAAIVKAFTQKFCDFPGMEVEAVGHGAGSSSKSAKKGPPNILRLILGKKSSEEKYSSPEKKNIFLDPGTKVIELSTNIDDDTPEMMGYLMERLTTKGATDIWFEPIYMKKNRPAYKLTLLCSVEKVKELTELIFRESSTLGIRFQEISRAVLDREIKKVTLPYGEVEVKIGLLGGKAVTASPEYESCMRLAKSQGKPLKEVYRDAIFFLSRR